MAKETERLNCPLCENLNCDFHFRQNKRIELQGMGWVDGWWWPIVLFPFPLYLFSHPPPQGIQNTAQEVLKRWRSNFLPFGSWQWQWQGMNVSIYVCESSSPTPFEPFSLPIHHVRPNPNRPLPFKPSHVLRQEYIRRALRSVVGSSSHYFHSEFLI